jgi:shikimate dehydrogenase
MSHPTRYLLAGVMGWPVMHSRSPMLHNYWLRQHSLVGAYLPLAIEADGLRAALRALPALGFAGTNLTIPHKEAAMAIVDEIDPIAKRIGAVNCVRVRKDGSLSACNYDALGYVESVLEAKPDWRADAGPVVVLGAGGASRAILVALAERGAREIRLLNRTPERAAALAAEFGAPIRALPWGERNNALEGAAMLIQTTSQGMVGQPALDLDVSRLPAHALVSDIVYVPLKTPLLAAAEARGLTAVGGLGMLLHQARFAFRDWFGILPEVTPDLRQMIESTL